MATGGEDDPDVIGSEDLNDVVCDPCQENGELHIAVGMCIDCQDHLCQKCFHVHKISGTSNKHELLDKDAMLRSQRSLVSITKDKCTEKCAVHEEEFMKYYCVNHSHLGCSVCITLDHRTCDSVRYIPHVAKDLANNEEYQQTESQLMSLVERSKKVTEVNKQKTESLKSDCSEAVKMVQDLRKQINKDLDKIEADLIRQCESMKSEETEKLASIMQKFKTTMTELNTLIAIKDTHQNNTQNCNLYTLVMKTKKTLKFTEDGITEAEKEQSHVSSQINFVVNKETLNTLKLPETLGKLLKSITSSNVRPEQTKTPARQKEQTASMKKVDTKTIVRAEHIQDINVKYEKDKNDCDITGLIVLPDNRLVLADWFYNGNVKLVDIKQGRVITYLTLSSKPYDVAMLTDSQVAITIPNNNKVAMVNVKAVSMTVGRTFDVDGGCWGVDYRDGKLAVSFLHPHKVQVLTLQGRVLYTITNDQQGQDLFNYPFYAAIGQDNTSIYVSNCLYSSNNVVHVKFDGTVVGTYTDSELHVPMGLLTDNSGYIYVCGQTSNNIHQMTSDCRKVKVLLTKADGVCNPRCIRYNETDCRLYVGMAENNKIKVYSVIFE